MPASSAIEVDGVGYHVHFQGFRQPLQVSLRDGREVALRPWTCGAHLDALGKHLRPGPGGIALDAPGFCADVLADSGLPAELAGEIGPLALWWAAGGEARPAARAGEDGWLELDGERARLRPWTHGERLRALTSSVVTGPDGRASFDVASYLEAMVRASVQGWAPAPRDPRELDAASTAALLDAVASLNVPDGPLEDELAEGLREGAQEVAAMTLRLCRAMGWTPSQVWAAPAAEIDRLLELLDAVEGSGAGSAPGAASGERLADHPDAVVIRIENDPE
ncbi:MAG TPA: hypothetical protein VND93_11720 [Myxococcales bacterium]|nr:hypothetical protein [Myxococcales bacterium]